MSVCYENIWCVEPDAEGTVRRGGGNVTSEHTASIIHLLLSPLLGGIPGRICILYSEPQPSTRIGRKARPPQPAQYLYRPGDFRNTVIA